MREASILALLVFAGGLLSAGCGEEPTTPSVPKTNEQLIIEFQKHLDDAVTGDSSIRNAVMTVDAPGRSLTWKGAAGVGEIYGHDGFPQSFMFCWPKHNVTIAGTLNQAASETVHYDQLVLGVIDLLRF